MKWEKIEWSQGELQRYQVMGLLERGKMTLQEAADEDGVILIQIQKDPI